MAGDMNRSAEYLAELLYRSRNGNPLYLAATKMALRELGINTKPRELLTYGSMWHEINKDRWTGQAGGSPPRDGMEATEAGMVHGVDWVPGDPSRGSRGEYLTPEGAERLAYRQVAYRACGLPVSPGLDKAIVGFHDDASHTD